MGNGASIEFERHQANRLFGSDDLRGAAETLCNDSSERLSFTNFIKEGVWLDDICLNSNFQAPRRSLMVASEHSLQLLHGYIVPLNLHLDTENSVASLGKEVLLTEEEDIGVEESAKTVNSRTSSPKHAFGESEKSASDSTKTVEILTSGIAGVLRGTKSANATRPSSVRDFHADYAHLETECSKTVFSKFQLMYFLFAILYPLYQTHRDSEGSFRESNTMCFMDAEGQCRCAVPCREPTLSADATKAQELLLAAAAHHDEERMLLHLSRPDWLGEMQQAFHQCPLGISICDARTGTGFPILYANSALQHMTGYTMKHLIGRTFHLLQGPDTETEQVDRMSSALKAKQSTRVVLTNYRKNGSKFVNMLALKPVFNQAGEYCYVIGVLFDVSKKGASLSELQQVDTILALLPLVITS